MEQEDLHLSLVHIVPFLILLDHLPPRGINPPPDTGYRTIQSIDIVHDPVLKREQLVTITATHLNFRNAVDQIQEKIRKLEREIKSITYDCRVLQSGASVEVQCHLPCGVTNNEKCLTEEKILNIIRHL